MKIHHIAISVRNLEKSAQFYIENFNFVEINRFTKPGWTGEAVILKNNEMQLELFAFTDHIDSKDDFQNHKQIGIKHIGIQVESVQKAYDKLKAKNIDLDIGEPKKGTTCAWFCFLRDPDGISLELYESN